MICGARHRCSRGRAAGERIGAALREALHKQQVQGDLPGAIKLYQRSWPPTGDRSVTARALLELGRLLRKLGQQAEALYQRFVRDFADQPVRAGARSLAALRPAAPAPATTLRKPRIPRTSGMFSARMASGPCFSVVQYMAQFCPSDISRGKQKRTVGLAPAIAHPIARPPPQYWRIDPHATVVDYEDRRKR